MTISRMHGLYAVKIGATVLGGIKRRAIRTASEVRQESTSGEVFARFQALYAQKPIAEFSSKHIAAGLDLCGLAGTALTSAAPLLFYAQKHAEGGVRTSGSNHRIYTMNEGLLLPRRITIEHQGDAEIEYEGLITYDGTNDPIALTDSSAVPAVTDAQRFTLGRITLTDDAAGAHIFSQVRRLEIDFGVSAETVGADSDIWDTSCRIIEIMPSITMKGIDIEWFKAANIPLTGLTVRQTGTEILLRKRAAGGTFVAAATSEHIAFGAAGLATVEQMCDASGNALDEVEVKIPLKFDGTNNPLTWDSTASYTP